MPHVGFMTGLTFGWASKLCVLLSWANFFGPFFPCPPRLGGFCFCAWLFKTYVCLLPPCCMCCLIMVD